MANNIVLRDRSKPILLTKNRQSYLGTLDWRLSTVNAAPDPTLGNSQFTEVSDGGYSASSLTFGSPTLNGSNQGQTVSNTATLTLAHSGGNYTVYVVYATDPADSNEWVLAALVTTPLPVTAPSTIAQIGPVTYLLDTLP